MITDQFNRVLKVVKERMEESGIRWAVIGSTNMALQGMDVVPRDLDIVVRLDDLKKIPEIFSDMVAQGVKDLPSMTGEPAWEVNGEIDGVEIQILGEKDTGQYVSKLINNRVKIVKTSETEIPCFALEAEADAYAETGREKKANLIREFLRGSE